MIIQATGVLGVIVSVICAVAGAGIFLVFFLLPLLITFVSFI